METQKVLVIPSAAINQVHSTSCCGIQMYSGNAFEELRLLSIPGYAFPGRGTRYWHGRRQEVIENWMVSIMYDS